MIHTSPKTQKSFQVDYDQFGDSFTEDTTAEQLKNVFDRVNKVRYQYTRELLLLQCIVSILIKGR